MTATDLAATTYAAPSLSGPKGLPLIGNLRDIRKDPLGYFTRVARDYGDVVPIRLGPERLLFINRPEYVRHVLQVNFKGYRKSDYYQRVRPIFGDSILMQEGESWLRLRRVAQPAFQGKRIRAMMAGISETAEEAVGRWQGAAGRGVSYELNQEMMRLVLDVVFRVLLQVRLGDRFEEVFHNLGIVLREAEHRVWTLTTLGQYLPSRRNRAFRQALSRLDDVVYGIIEARRQDEAGHEDLLSLFMAAFDDPASPASSNRQLRDEILTFLIGGHETTAAGLAWTFHLLSEHPEVEARLWQEVDEVLGGRPPGFDDLPRLPYTRAVFDEAVRLYPPVWTISRTALTDDMLGDVPVPKGTTVMLSPFALQRNPRHWPEPEAFDPRRFLPENEKRIEPFAYFPFGGGPRACIGARLATVEATLILARIAQSFRIRVLPDQIIEPEPTITLRPRFGIHAEIEPRTKGAAWSQGRAHAA
ncbi:MAG: cytochrome P450 [Alphaproteobacteria bacterium]|jgi:cytochrome P450|nr:cytochrome P450 [Alphaproteobacteria bacterium]